MQENKPYSYELEEVLSYMKDILTNEFPTDVLTIEHLIVSILDTKGCHANMILEQIKNGYEPNDADVFELCCDEQDKIDEYREMYDIKQRVKDGQISEKDYNYLINKIGVSDEYLESTLRQAFTESGKLVEDYETPKSMK